MAQREVERYKHRREVARLSETIGELRVAERQRAAQATSLAHQLAACAQARGALEAEVAQKNARIMLLERDIEDLGAEIETRDARIALLEQTIIDLGGTIP